MIDALILGTMITKIFHPNMSKSGEICVDTLKKGWKKEYGVGHVLVVSNRTLVTLLGTLPNPSADTGDPNGLRTDDRQTIKCLLIYPNPESALDEEAGKQLLADYEGYCKVCIRAVFHRISKTLSSIPPHVATKTIVSDICLVCETDDLYTRYAQGEFGNPYLWRCTHLLFYLFFLHSGCKVWFTPLL